LFSIKAPKRIFGDLEPQAGSEINLIPIPFPALRTSNMVVVMLHVSEATNARIGRSPVKNYV
jgi:hypothetical protein